MLTSLDEKTRHCSGDKQSELLPIYDFLLDSDFFRYPLF